MVYTQKTEQLFIVVIRSEVAMKELLYLTYHEIHEKVLAVRLRIHAAILIRSFCWYEIQRNSKGGQFGLAQG